MSLEFRLGFRKFLELRMSTLVKVQPKGQMTVPRRFRSAVGLVDGDLVEVRADGKRIVTIPESAVDRSKFPNADDEYTPAQRRLISGRLDKAEKGPFHGPYKNGAEVSTLLGRKVRRASSSAKSRKSE
jgi:AbrB family looped-hinge helix DNA binding protein